VLVVYKKTALQRYGKDDARIVRLIAEGDASVEVLEHAHETHVATLERAKNHLQGRKDLSVTFRHQHDGDDNGWDLVITLGGDGTLLWASHTVDASTPMLAINSSPRTSVGYFCAGAAGELESLIDRALAGDLPSTRLSRMQVAVDGEVHTKRVLNDILFCHRSPAAATRYLIAPLDADGEPMGEREAHTSSGIWVGPAAGSTAAQRSAGGKVLRLQSKKIQWVVREPYRPGETELAHTRGLLKPGQSLSVKSKIREGRIFFDGAQKVSKVDIGSEIRMTRSDESLTLLGLRARGRK
jgi:NAD+ kinase